MTATVPPPGIPPVKPSSDYVGISSARDDLLRNKHVYRQEGLIQPRRAHPHRYADGVATLLQEFDEASLSQKGTTKPSAARRRRTEENAGSRMSTTLNFGDGSSPPRPKRSVRKAAVDPRQLFTSRWIQRDEAGKRSMELMVGRVPNTVDYFSVSTPEDIDVTALYKRERRAVDTTHDPNRDNLTVGSCTRFKIFSSHTHCSVSWLHRTTGL